MKSIRITAHITVLLAVATPVGAFAQAGTSTPARSGAETAIKKTQKVDSITVKQGSAAPDASVASKKKDEPAAAADVFLKMDTIKGEASEGQKKSDQKVSAPKKTDEPATASDMFLKMDTTKGESSKSAKKPEPGKATAKP